MADLKNCTFVMACYQYFGKKTGETMQEFTAELKALTDEDKIDMIGYFRVIDIDATKPSVGA